MIDTGKAAVRRLHKKKYVLGMTTVIFRFDTYQMRAQNRFRNNTASYRRLHKVNFFLVKHLSNVQCLKKFCQPEPTILYVNVILQSNEGSYTNKRWNLQCCRGK